MRWSNCNLRSASRAFCFCFSCKAVQCWAHQPSSSAAQREQGSGSRSPTTARHGPKRWAWATSQSLQFVWPYGQGTCAVLCGGLRCGTLALAEAVQGLQLRATAPLREARCAPARVPPVPARGPVAGQLTATVCAAVEGPRPRRLRGPCSRRCLSARCGSSRLHNRGDTGARRYRERAANAPGTSVPRASAARPHRRPALGALQLAHASSHSVGLRPSFRQRPT